MLYVILGACGPGDMICRHSRPMQEREVPPVSVTWQNVGAHLQSEWAYMGQHCSCVPQTSCSLHCVPSPPPSPRIGFERTRSRSLLTTNWSGEQPCHRGHTPLPPCICHHTSTASLPDHTPTRDPLRTPCKQLGSLGTMYYHEHTEALKLEPRCLINVH